MLRLWQQVIVCVILSMLSSCIDEGEQSYTRYLALDQEVWQQAHTSPALPVCFQQGGQPQRVRLMLRYDHRIRHDRLDFELSLNRWGQAWAKDTVCVSFLEYRQGYKGRRPLVYDAEADKDWSITPPIAGIYQIAMRPLGTEQPLGIVALGLRQEQ